MAQRISPTSAASPILPSATVAGSTAISATLAAQTTLAALSIAATSESTTGTATRQWSVYLTADDSDVTGTVISADDDTAAPTWADFPDTGTYRIEYALTGGCDRPVVSAMVVDGEWTERGSP